MFIFRLETATSGDSETGEKDHDMGSEMERVSNERQGRIKSATEQSFPSVFPAAKSQMSPAFHPIAWSHLQDKRSSRSSHQIILSQAAQVLVSHNAHTVPQLISPFLSPLPHGKPRQPFALSRARTSNTLALCYTINGEGAGPPACVTRHSFAVLGRPLAMSGWRDNSWRP